jgi:hypothetical protein
LGSTSASSTIIESSSRSSKASKDGIEKPELDVQTEPPPPIVLDWLAQARLLPEGPLKQRKPSEVDV